MPRFYCPQPLAIGLHLDLPDTVAHHVNVVRLAPGDAITLFNGEGGEYTAVLETVEKRRASATIKAYTPLDTELPYAITLAQALPEGSKMDWIVEKAVELGTAAVQPLAARRCVVKLAGDRAEKKLSHWQGIIIAASEQCGRNRVAQLAPVADFRDWISQQDLHRRVLLTPRATQSLADWARHQPPQALTIMVGPEGGFSDEEEDAAMARGALALSMGPRVLRTETAALAAIAALNAAWGGM
ncbi:16S rRNA (uracil(1498)-N(3))-methyltransferase [Duganella sp. FT92W]|uniref:Ribosomal RNA small subunit methyltransferase E n=1 Tax=Pseudoduganella rivuli TaxID=2666085 RepID=A0A7X2LU66_9BURK|nr:16S rRNA (uracil(1498)-N(3))-methyltransferase [Pseudoduganella rivuli]MRV75345.1 16S rRNA (uracil(1498)-N(3))-methyltransferase [Pseudoduganella rivuli]